MRIGNLSQQLDSHRAIASVATDPAYPDAKQLLISADSGGINGWRLRLLLFTAKAIYIHSLKFPGLNLKTGLTST